MEPEEFAARHGRDLLGLAMALTTNRVDGEDLLQDAYVRLLRNWGAIEKAEEPYAYARRTLVNTFLNSRRRAKIITLTRDGTAPPDQGRHDIHDDGATPVTRALGALPPQQRAVLALRYLGDMSDTDIAAEMGIGLSAVRSHASRGLAALRTSMTGANEEALDA